MSSSKSYSICLFTSGAWRGVTFEDDGTYGLDPALLQRVGASSATPAADKEMQPLTSVKDRGSNIEALSIAFAVEKGWSLSSVPDLIEYGKV